MQRVSRCGTLRTCRAFPTHSSASSNPGRSSTRHRLSSSSWLRCTAPLTKLSWNGLVIPFPRTISPQGDLRLLYLTGSERLPKARSSRYWITSHFSDLLQEGGIEKNDVVLLSAQQLP